MSVAVQQQMSSNQESQWQDICDISALVANSGVCALLNTGEQVAIFYLPGEQNSLYAIGNYDPIGKANVLYRGIIGSIKDEPVVASPLYKQHFSLRTGQCLEDEVSVPVFEIRLTEQRVQILSFSPVA